MKGYRQFCPMARASELVAERWTPVILRNLMAGCETFGAILEGAPGLSRTLLSERLRKLERHGILERRPARMGHTYHLTAMGRGLWPVLDALGTWGARFLDLRNEHLDPYPVLWDMSRLIPEESLPPQRVVIRFEITDAGPRRRFWLVLGPGHREVCTQHPGYDEDLHVRTDRRSLALWHLGRLPLGAAMAEGLIEVEGAPRLVRALASRWQGLSLFAHVAPEEAAQDPSGKALRTS